MPYELYCNFTDECDKYINDSYQNVLKQYGFRTYLMADYYANKSKYIPFRFPGATRGCIKIDYDTMEILKVILYETSVQKVSNIGCYTEEIENVKKMVGQKIIIYDETGTPKKPIKRYIWGYGKAVGYSCPNCKFEFPIGWKETQCKECGQQIDWDF